MKEELILKYLTENTNIKEYVDLNDYEKALRYSKDDIQLKKQIVSNGITRYFYKIPDYYGAYYIDVEIRVNKMTKRILKVDCDCYGYRPTCEHILAIFLHCYEEIFDMPIEINMADIGKLLIDKYTNSNKVNIKKEARVELSFTISERNYYYRDNYEFNLELLMGEKRLYKATNKIGTIKNVYYQGSGSVRFGKEFTYNPEEYYFSKESETILNALFEMNAYNYYGVSSKELKIFLQKISDVEFSYGNYKHKGIKKGFPLKSKLEKENDKFYLSFDKEDIEQIFENDLEYIVYKGELYHLNKKEQELLVDLFAINAPKIEFEQSDLENFSKGMLSIIKDNVSIDDTVNEVKLAKKINCELYFDLRNSYILCNPVLKYDGESINYFDKKSPVLRDEEYENEVINNLLKYGFIIEKEKIVLKELEQMVEFIETGLEELANNYVIFTTEKFKNVNIKKKTNVRSTFSIGQDNILSYGFELGDINNDELVNIFKEIKNKKKYYRLKNGDILNLEDKQLQELEELSEELEFTDEEIINGRGTFLKYRAIYLDSLKDTKYSIIHTDNLFDNFIDNFYKYKNSKLTLSKNELSILREYQLTGVKWLYNLDKTGFGGILADEMGLGKTIQAIFYIKQILKDDKNKKVLIVVPTSLAYNWEHEFNLFGSSIKKAICVGKKDTRINILNNLKDINVIVTTYGLLREDYDLYKDLSFDTFIIDEAQNIKNNLAGVTKCVKGIKATTRFALTGTPLENSVLELWSIFDFIMPGYLASLSKFQSKYKIKDYDEDTDKLIKGLSKQINPFILRRKKNDVVKELPDKLINDIYIELDEKQKVLYAAELEKVKQEIANTMETGGMSKVRFVMLTLLTRLRQICIDPKILYEDYDGKSNKIDTLCNVVKEYTANGHKILIFSSFLTGLNSVKEVLEKNKIKTYMIEGGVNAKKRMEMVDDFNNGGDVPVFLIMLKSGGTGINLTSADVVIHLDLWWNPQAENQATDRAHRIGQTKTVEVIHLIMKGTIEEKILELQNKKRILSDKLIDGELRNKNILSDLTEEDIKNLLAFENRD